MTWQQRGPLIGGTEIFESFSAQVKLNADNTVLAVSAPRHNSDTGRVTVFDKDGDTWKQRGAPFNSYIYGEITDGFFGNAIAISADGNTLACAAYFHGATGDGRVRVFTWNGSSWVQKGNTLIGGTGDVFGYSMDMNDAGDTLIVGAPAIVTTFGSPPTQAGTAIAYGFVGGSWQQLGTVLTRGIIGDSFGLAVSMNSSGDSIIVSGPEDNVPSNAGIAKMYKYSTPGATGGTWNAYGADLVGNNDDGFGYYCKMNADGTRIIVSALSLAPIIKVVRVYEYNSTGGTWDQVGTNLESEGPPTFFSSFGIILGMNGAGDIIAIGGGGRVRIFRFSTDIGDWETLGETISAWANRGVDSAIEFSSSGKILALGGHLSQNLFGQSTGAALIYDLIEDLPGFDIDALISYNEEGFQRLLDNNPTRYYGIYNTKIYDFTDLIAKMPTIPPSQNATDYVATNPDIIEYITSTGSYTDEETNIFDVLNIFTTNATNNEISNKLETYDIRAVGYYRPSISYTDTETINVLTTNPTQYLVKYDGIIYDFTYDFTSLSGTYPAILAGSNVDIFNRINTNDTVTYPNLTQFMDDVVNNFSLGFARYVRFGNDGSPTLTQNESEIIDQIFTDIVLTAGTVETTATNYVVLGETNDAGKDKFRNVGKMMETLLRFSKGSIFVVNAETGAISSTETGISAYIGVLTNAKNNIKTDLLTLQYEKATKEVVIADVLSDSHTEFTLNRTSVNSVEGMLLFYYTDSDLSLMADQVDIMYRLGARYIGLVLTGMNDATTLEFNNNLPLYRTVENNLIAKIVNRLGSQITNVITTSIVRYNVQDNNYTNLFTLADALNDKISVFQNIGSVPKKIVSEERGTRILITSATASRFEAEIIYGFVPNIVPKTYVTNRVNNGGTKTTNFSQAVKVFDADMTRMKLASAGSNLQVGDVLYDSTTVRNTYETATILCSFNTLSSIVLSLINNSLVSDIAITIRLGILETNPKVSATIIKFDKYVNKTNYRQTNNTATFANIPLDDTSDYILEIKLPSDIDLPIEKYADYPRLGMVTIHEADGGLLIGRGVVLKLNTTSTI
jgi:hypothetical protein